MPRIKIKQREEDEELRYGDDVQGVQCKDGIERLAMFGGEGGRCFAMPYWLSQVQFQQSVSIYCGGVNMR